MFYKLLGFFLLSNFFLNTTFAASFYQEARSQISSISKHTNSLDTQDTCKALSDISKKFEKGLFEYSCPTESELEFQSCQQKHDFLTGLETRNLQHVLNEFQSITNDQCQLQEPSALAIKIKEATQIMN